MATLKKLTTNSDAWNGLAVDDYLDASAGDDTLDGGLGNDTLYGGFGNDLIAGGYANDSLRGGDGNDVLDADIGNDTLFGDAGDDILFGGSGLDTLDGGAGSDYLYGDLDNDKLTGGAGSDMLDGGEGADTLVDNAYTTATVTWGMVSTENDELIGGAGNDTFYGGYDAMWGGEGNDLINVRNQGEIYGGVGDDKIILTNTSALLGSLLDGGDGNDSITAGSGNDTLIGGYGQDTLAGGKGNDTYVMTFDNMADKITEATTGGVDTIYFIRDFVGDERDDDVDAATGKELNAVTTATGYTVTLAANIENGVLDDQVFVNNPAASFAYTVASLTGNALNNKLQGSQLSDMLNGAAGNDTIVAGDGNDTIDGAVSIVNSSEVVTGDTILVGGTTLVGKVALLVSGGGDDNDNDTILAGGGNDIIFAGVGVDSIDGGFGTDLIASSGTFDLGTVTSVENLDLLDVAGALNGIGTNGANKLYGNQYDNQLEGKGGNDLLDGWFYSTTYATATIKTTGNDTLTGGTGNDFYRIDSSNDVVVEVNNTTGGTDTVEFNGAVLTDSYVMTAGVENLVMLANLKNADGNNLNNRITGNSLANVLKGGYGNDYLIGGTGADTFEGGYGSDTFVVDSIADTIREFAGQGIDWVESANITLDLNVQGNWTDIENARLTGTSALNVTGRETNNNLVGNSGNNVMDGRYGIDTLEGGLGNDTYIVDTTTDTLLEVTNVVDATGKILTGSIDTVQSDVSFTLASLLNIENLSLSGTVAMTGTGNINDNYLRGNDVANDLFGLSGNDTLDGAGGQDTLSGGTGDDVYLLSNDNDVVVELENEGYDRIETSSTYSLTGLINFENLTLTGTNIINGTGNAASNKIIGNSAANVLMGLDNNDTLVGGEGADTLVGGTGADTLDLTESKTAKDIVRFAFGDSKTNASEADNILKFSAAYDGLDFGGTIKIGAGSVAAVNGIDFGLIKSHKIDNGIIKFDDLDVYSLPLPVTTAVTLNGVVEYLKLNVTDGSTVAFQFGSTDTYVFQDDGAGSMGTGDTLIKLVGVAGITSLSSTAWGVTTLHVE